MGETHPSNMRLTIALLCLAAVAYSAPLGNSEMTEMFSAFKSEFNKVYETETELLQRYEMFTKNVNIINNENEAASAGYTMAINQFTDWTTQEFSAYLTYNGTAKKHDRIVLLDETDLATSVDWTTKGAVTPVKNQAQCGSCWAFSTTGSAEGALAIAAGLGANSLVSLSEQQLVDCAGSQGNQGCNGGLMDDGFKWVIENGGITTEADYAYTAKDGTCDTTVKSAVKITSFTDVTSGDEDALLAALQTGPVSIAIEADKSGFQFYKSGVFSGDCGTQLDHGVLLVGAGTDAGVDYWRVKNSWGTVWGDVGFIRMVRGQDQCGLALAASQ